MIRLFKHLVFLTLLLCFNNLKVKAQNEFRPNFIGVNPSLTIEPFYEKGEMDINIFPIVYQRPLTKRVDIRFTSICNLGIRNIGNKISHFGLETALPLYFKKKEEKKESSKGFFLAPIVSVTKNRLENHNNLGLWIEPGYNILFDNNYALSIGLQLGGTYFDYNNGQNKWGQHLGVKIIFGKWM